MCSAELLRSVLEMGHGVAQTLRETRSSSNSRWMRDTGFFRPTFDAELLRLMLNAGLLWPAFEVSVLFWTRGPRFSQNATFELKFGSCLMACP